jgi:cell division protein ZapE
VVRLVDRSPEVGADDLVATLVPPPLFADRSFSSYLPDPAQPTQAAAVAALEVFAARVSEPTPERSWWRRAPAPPEGRSGLYLDGGFGVGKTHLLAALWHAVPGPKLFGTFVELTNLVGALGFADAVDRLADHRLVCIDEFELDDPGDTVLMSTLLGRLTEAGVRLAATSNTLPDRLGEERFAAADFLREIHGLAAHFDVVRIEGADYRHRDSDPAPQPATDTQLVEAEQQGVAVASDDFDALLEHLSTLHPSRYGALVSGVETVIWRGVHPITDQAVALRFVVLVDRLYDRDVRVLAGGESLSEVFPPEMLRGGYRKKYYRALSRLTALAR